MKVSVGCQGRVVNPFLQPGAMDHSCSRAAVYEPYSMQRQFWQPGESLETPDQHSAYHELDRRLTPNRQVDSYDNISHRGHDWVEESSVRGVSSGTNSSQDELQIAEVNPVTFEVMPSSLRHHREKIVTEHDNNSSPIASSAHSPSKPCHKVDVVFDGESGYPTVCLSECHCALPMSPRKSSPALQPLNHVLEGNGCSRIKLMCSFGGRIQPRPVDGQLRYTGGETRIVAVNRGIGFSEFMSKMTQIYGLPVVLKYQLPGEDLDALISVSTDDDFQNMIEEYDKLEVNGGVSRLRLFFFTCPCEHETQPAGLESDMKDCHIDLEQQHYIGVRNGITDKLSWLHLKDVPDSLPAKIIHEVPSTMIGLSGSRHLSRVPSAPSSSPSSPSVGSRLRGLCMGEALNDNTSIAVHTHGGNVKSHQDGYTELVCPFHCDHPPHFPGGSPKTLYDNPFSKVDSRWGPNTGVHGLDSQVNFVNQSEHHIDQVSAVGAMNKWHDAQHPPDMLVPAGGFVCHHHQPQQVSQQTPLTTGQLHLEDMVGKGEGFQHCPLDMCKPSQAFYHPYQATPHFPQAGYCCVSQPLHGQYAITHVSDHPPFMQGPLQSHVQVPYVAGTTAYKLGSAPSSPRMRIQDVQGNCSCIQHTHVHRGINVSLGDGNRTSPSFDQSSRKPGLPICSRFCDNLANSNEPSGWQKQPGHFIGFEGDQQEHIDNSWQHIHDLGSVHYHMPDSQEDTNAFHHHHTPLYNETALKQPHDVQAASKKRYPGFNCNESGRQPIEKARAYSACMEPGGQIGNPVTEERVALLERALENLPFHKDEDYDCEIHSVGSFSSTDAIAGSLSRVPSDKGWFDVLPHLQTEYLHALDELPTANSVAEFTIAADEKNLPSVGLIEMKEDSHGYSVPVVADTVVGEPELDLHHLSPSVNEPLEAGYENQIATFPHVLSSITTSSKFEPRAAGGWEALPSNSLSITTLEKSPTNTVLPIYDQSPLSSSNMANFSFEQRQDIVLAGAEQINNAGREFTDDRSFFTEELISNGGRFDDIHKVLGNGQPFSESTTEAALKSRTMEDVSSPHSLAGQGKGGALFETGQHYVKVPEEWPAGVSAVIQERISNPVTHQDELIEVGSVCAKEVEDVPITEAEKEAIARGLQIIKNDDVEDLKELGTGTYGTVFHGKWRGSDVAIKRIKASCFTGQPSVQERLVSDFWREAGMLSQLHHPNIVAFYGVVPDGPGGTLATVTEYMVNGSLKQVLQKKDRTIDRKKRLLIAMDAAFGMEYLHSKNVVHFDLKSENLLVNMRDAHRPICKVGDFGLSKVKHQTLVSGGVRGTLPWMAPELLCGKNGRVTEKVDVFSFGIVMWELLTGDEPYAKMHCGAIIGGIVNNTLRPQVPNWCDPHWRSLMEKCWSGDPADRPTFTEVARELRAIAASMNVK